MAGECELGGELVWPLAFYRVNRLYCIALRCNRLLCFQLKIIFICFCIGNGDAQCVIQCIALQIRSENRYLCLHLHILCAIEKIAQIQFTKLLQTIHIKNTAGDYEEFNFRLVLSLQIFIRCRREKPTMDVLRLQHGKKSGCATAFIIWMYQFYRATKPQKSIGFDILSSCLLISVREKNFVPQTLTENVTFYSTIFFCSIFFSPF